MCGLMVLYANGTCVLRARPHFGHTDEAHGAAVRTAQVAMVCMHAARILYRPVTPAIGGDATFARMAASEYSQMHLCASTDIHVSACTLGVTTMGQSRSYAVLLTGRSFDAASWILHSNTIVL